MIIKKLINYKNNSLLIIFIFILLSTSCELFNPETDDDQPNNEDYNLIGSQTVGPNGGEINLDSIIVKIPNGAFNESNVINIYTGVENDGYGEDANSALFRIEGLPNTINKSIKLNVKYHKSFTGDPLFAIGQIKYVTSLDSSLMTYHSENAADSSGYLVYNLPAKTDLYRKLNRVSEEDALILNMIALGSYKRALSSNGHFNMTYPTRHEQDCLAMAEYFEDAYNKCIDMGFSYYVRQWPVNVIIKYLRMGLYGYYTSYGSATNTDEQLRGWINDGDFTINLNYINDELALKTTCGHEFLHLVQNLYEFSSAVEPEQKWLKEATSTWIMEKYANDQNYYPSIIRGRERYMFNGWQYSAPNHSNAEQGYGLAMLIKEIADTHGDDSIVEIFENIMAGTLPDNSVDPVEAVLNVINIPIREFWHRVLSNYIQGIYYNKQLSTYLLDNPNNYLKIVTVDETNDSHSLTFTYPDLSGDIFKIQPGNISSLNKMPLNISVNYPLYCGLLVCKYKNGGDIAVIDEVYPGESGYIKIGDAKPIFESGYEIIVLVTNTDYNENLNYLDNKSITLNINLENTLDLDFRWAYLNIEAKAFYQRTSPDTSYEDPYWENYGTPTWVNQIGNMTDSTFTAAWDTTWEDNALGTYHWTGSITAEFNSDFSLLKNYSEVQHSNYSTGWRNIDSRVEVTNVPFESYSPGYSRIYRTDTGTTTCSYINTWTENVAWPLDGMTYILSRYECDDQSYIKVEFFE